MKSSSISLLFGIATLVSMIPSSEMFHEDSAETFSVFVKIILPIAPTEGESQLAVESWIQNKLDKHGVFDIRAETGWVRIVDGEKPVVQIWDATVDGKMWGCPVHGWITEISEDGKVKLELSGWTPIGAQVIGQNLQAEIGTRKIATVFIDQDNADGEIERKVIAYVALLVGPGTPESVGRQIGRDEDQL